MIGGWVTKYIYVFATGQAEQSTQDGYFDQFIAQPIEPIIWFLVFIGITAVIVLCGVEKGIEKMSKIMMPILVVLTVFIAIYAMFMPGAMEGVVYYLKPDFSKFFVQTVLAAMGQQFYSLSLAMGIMITYGSYMKKDVHIETSVQQIALFDCGIAALAGLMVIPAVFSFSGGDESALGKGPGLMFVTLPKVFESMAGGQIVGFLFFVLVFFAALTSSISLMEAVVSILCDKFGMGRKKSCLLVLIGSVALGLLSALGYGVLGNAKIFGMQFLDFFDFFSNSILMPIVAILTCVFIGYIIGPKQLTDEAEITGKMKTKKMFNIFIKYIAPVCIVLILISSVLDALGIVQL